MNPATKILKEMEKANSFEKRVDRAMSYKEVNSGEDNDGMSNV